MVTTRAGHAKKILGAELDDDDGGAALAGGTSPSRTSEGMPAPGPGGIDSGGGFRRRGSTKSADGLVRALRLAGGGGTPSLTFPLPWPRRRSAGFILLGLQRFVFAMAVLKRSLEEGIDWGTHLSVTYTKSLILSDGVF